jgi:hypothetical protein
MQLNPLRLVARRHDQAFDAALVSDLNRELDRTFRPNFSLIEREVMDNESSLAGLCSEKQALEDEIADRTERLRQVRVAIGAREAQAAELAKGLNPVAQQPRAASHSSEPVMPLRRVPRHVPADADAVS